MDLTSDLIGYWALDELSGAAIDSHGDNDLTAVNAPGTVAGKINTSRDFVSASNKCFTSSSTDFPLNTDPFSLSVWVKLTASVSNQMVVTRWNQASLSTSHYQLFASPSLGWRFILMRNGATPVAVNGPSVITNVWTHILCYSIPGVEIGIRVNGGSVATTASASATTNTASEIVLGSRNNGASRDFYWQGQIDELAFWGRVISSDEQLAVYNDGDALSYSQFAAKRTQRRQSAQTIIRGAF